MTNRAISWRLLVATAALAWAVPTAPVLADEVDDEFRFATGLIEYGFPDLAGKVIARLEQDHPDAIKRIQVARAEILIAQRKFKEVEAVLAKMPPNDPKTQAISLALANKYNALGQIDKAQPLYDEFFKQFRGKVPTDPDLLRFYQESAYRMVQMLETAGDFKGAIESYALLLKTNPPKDVQRRVQIELAELYLKVARSTSNPEEKKKALGQAWKICEKIQWEYDLWFGRSIPIMANVKVLQGDRTGAQKLLKDYMKDLAQIDTMLKEADVPRSLSPMAHARYLLGDLYMQDARPFIQQKNKEKATPLLAAALKEYINVFRKYPDSDWGPEANVKATEIQKTLAQLGVNVRINDRNLPQQTGVNRSAFKAAHNLYFQKKYQDAINGFVRVLNTYPESEPSVEALGVMLLCYGELGDKLGVKMVSSYLAERFSKSDTAAMNILRIAKLFVDKGDTEMYYGLYDLYLDHFTAHDKADLIVWTLSGLAGKNGDQKRSDAYAQRLIDDFPNSQYRSKALSKSAFLDYKAGKYEGALPALRQYVEADQPGYTKAQAQFFIGNTLKELDRHDEALKEYSTLVKWLAPETNNPFRGTLDEEKVLELLRQARFFMAYSLSQIPGDPAQVKPLREKAVEVLDGYVADFPDSELAPKALRLKGGILLELGQDELAGQTFDQLSKTYPDTEEGKNAFFYVVDSFIELGKLDKAKTAFASMMKNAGLYTPDQFTRIGESMLAREFYAEAEQAYDQALKSGSDDRAVQERALFGLGRARAKLGKFEIAAEPLEKFKEAFPSSAFYYDVRFALGEVYRELGRPADAVIELADVFRYSKDGVQQNRASLEYARVAATTDDKSDGLAAYIRVSLLGNPDDAALRPLIKTALLEGIDLAVEMERWDDVIDQADQFNDQFADSEEIQKVRDIRRDARSRTGGTAGGA